MCCTTSTALHMQAPSPTDQAAAAAVPIVAAALPPQSQWDRVRAAQALYNAEHYGYGKVWWPPVVSQRWQQIHRFGGDTSI